MNALAVAKKQTLNLTGAFAALLNDLKQLEVPAVASAVAMVVAGIAGGLLGLPVTAATVGPYLVLIGVVSGVVQKLVAKPAFAPTPPPASSLAVADPNLSQPEIEEMVQRFTTEHARSAHARSAHLPMVLAQGMKVTALAEFVVNGYDPASQTQHGFGPYADQAKAEADAAEAKQLWSTWTVAVLPVSPLSEKFIQASPATWLLRATPFEYGPESIVDVYLSDDPAALDALGAAKQASGAATDYQVIPLKSAVGQ